jgi:hypothetical protein
MGAFGASSGATADIDKSLIAGLSYYYRQYGVAQFNMSFFSRLVTNSDTESHTGVITKLNAAGSTANITTNPFDFTGQPALPAIDQIDFRLLLDDGDTGAGNFDVDNLVLQLDNFVTPLKLNGFDNGQFQSINYRFGLSNAQSTALLAEMADNQLMARIRRVADLADTDTGDNSGNNVEPADGVGPIHARISLSYLNDNGASKAAMALDNHIQAFDTMMIKSAGNTGDWSKRITAPGDFYNGITVGAVTVDFSQRVSFSAYHMRNDNGDQPDLRGKPEVVAPGETIFTEFYGGVTGNGDDGTSFAAPHVSGIVALLQKGTENQAGLALGTSGNKNHLAIKSIIMNSARKRMLVGPEATHYQLFDNANTGNEGSDGDYLQGTTFRNGTEAGAPKTREWTPSSWSYTGNVFTTFRPLDDELGTGLVDAERALIQLDGGKQNANTGVTPIGWNIETLSAGSRHDYGLDFAITAGQFLTATLNWDRLITRTDDGDGIFDFADTFAPNSLPDLDLKIFYQGNLYAQSIGVLDNFEHLHIPLLHAGSQNDYFIRVDHFSGGASNYGLSWWVGAAVPEPTTATLLLLMAAMLGCQRQRGSRFT